jgi:hypothetical protein
MARYILEPINDFPGYINMATKKLSRLLNTKAGDRIFSGAAKRDGILRVELNDETFQKIRNLTFWKVCAEMTMEQYGERDRAKNVARTSTPAPGCDL